MYFIFFKYFFYRRGTHINTYFIFFKICFTEKLSKTSKASSWLLGENPIVLKESIISEQGADVKGAPALLSLEPNPQNLAGEHGRDGQVEPGEPGAPGLLGLGTSCRKSCSRNFNYLFLHFFISLFLYFFCDNDTMTILWPRCLW